MSIKNKLTLDEKLYKRKIHLPNKFLYGLIYHLGKIVFKKYNMDFNIIDDPNKLENGPIVVVANHASRNDFLFAAIPLYPRRLNFVAAYNEFMRSNLAWLFRTMQIIPKRQFYNDSYTVFEIASIAKKFKGNIVFYPEGLATLFGASSPITPGTSKLLKFLKLPVYSVITNGAFLIQPKHKFGKKERYAKTETTIKRLFSVEDLKNLSIEEMDDKLNEALYIDDFKWAKDNHIVYKDNKDPIAEGFETYLYKCPKCSKEFTLEAKGNHLYCSSCGNGATINNDYSLTKDNDECKIPSSLTKWYDYMRIKVHEELLANPDYKLEVKASVAGIPDYRYVKPFEYAVKYGEGTLTLSLKDGFSFVGKNINTNEDIVIKMNNKELYNFIMSYGTDRIHFFYKGKLTEFTFPDSPKAMPAKIMLTQEEISRICNGEYPNYKFFKYDENECFKPY